MQFKLSLAVAAMLTVAASDRYNGPRPPQPDIPYLLHADHLVQTEVADAREQGGKKESTFVIPGASSPARTPLAEPIFLMRTKDISPDSLELYRLEVRNGQREVVISQRKRGRGDYGPFHLMVNPIEGDLYRVEADEPLPDGEYSLSPNGSNKVFCFEIY